MYLMQKKKICNLCGRELNMFDLNEDFSIAKQCGYGTKYDGCVVKIRICCNCIDNLPFKPDVYGDYED